MLDYGVDIRMERTIDPCSRENTVFTEVGRVYQKGTAKVLVPCSAKESCAFTFICFSMLPQLFFTLHTLGFAQSEL